MTIEYQVTEQDYIHFNFYHCNHSKQAKQARWILRYVTAALFVLAFLILYQDRPSAYIVSIVMAGVWIALFPIYYDNHIKRTVKKMIREGKNNDFIGPQKLTLKEDGIEEASPYSTSLIQYSAVERIGCGYNCIFIYIGAVKAIIVSLSAFSDDGQRNEFIGILKEKTGIDPVS